MTKGSIKAIPGMLIIMLLPTIAVAQGHFDYRNATPEEIAKYQTDWMKKEISLDSATVSAIYTINLKYAKMNHEIMQSDEPGEDKFSKFRANNDEKDKELQKILTAEQFTLYQQKQEERRQRMREQRNNE